MRSLYCHFACAGTKAAAAAAKKSAATTAAASSRDKDATSASTIGVGFKVTGTVSRGGTVRLQSQVDDDCSADDAFASNARSSDSDEE
jgi:hypothetical protein